MYCCCFFRDGGRWGGDARTVGSDELISEVGDFEFKRWHFLTGTKKKKKRKKKVELCWSYNYDAKLLSCTNFENLPSVSISVMFLLSVSALGTHEMGCVYVVVGTHVYCCVCLLMLLLLLLLLVLLLLLLAHAGAVELHWSGWRWRVPGAIWHAQQLQDRDRLSVSGASTPTLLWFYQSQTVLNCRLKVVTLKTNMVPTIQLTF